MEPKKKNKYELSKDHWIEKSNTLNEIRNSKMTLSQIRLFSIYLSKINPKDIKTRLVLFKLSEYIRIMEFKQMNITRLQQTAEDLLGLTACFKELDGGLTICQLFKRFKLFKGDDNEWYVSIDCHDDILPLMFEFQRYYFKYKLWNALKLTSSSQQRMYEILKQYEYAGAREISVKDLREFLGIGKDEYDRWERFRVRVLDSCQQALQDFTDIKFTWEPTGKRGKGGKIEKLKFNIEKNNNYTEQITLYDFIELQDEPDFEDEPQPFEYNNEKLEFFAEAFNNQFAEPEAQVLWDLVTQVIPFSVDGNLDIERYDYMRRKYNELQARKTRKDLSPVKSNFAWLKDKINRDVEAIKNEND